LGDHLGAVVGKANQERISENQPAKGWIPLMQDSIDVRSIWRNAPHSQKANFFEFVIRECIFQFATKESTALDIGSDGGAHAIHMAEAVGSTGHVIAFEPNPRAVAKERLAPYPQARVLNVALSDTDGDAILHVATETAMCSLHVRPHQNVTIVEDVTVPCFRLDTLAQTEDIGYVSVIKIDVEGNDVNVVKGAEQTLTRSRPLILTEMDWRHLFGIDEAKAADYLSSLAGFACSYVPLNFFGERLLPMPPETFAQAWNIGLVPKHWDIPATAHF
jgi:FkbM family methyltransferase